MKTIHKFDLYTDDRPRIMMPRGAVPIHVAIQHGKPRLWAIVETDEPMEPHFFITHGTGHPLAPDIGAHIGSYQLLEGALVFHLFEVTK